MVSILHLLRFMLKSVYPVQLLFLWIDYFIIWLILKQYLTNTPKLICAYFATDSELTFTLYKAILWTKDLFDVF